MADDEKTRALKSIRVSMAALGFSIDNLTDEQIEDGLKSFGTVAGRFGVATKDLIVSFAKLGDVLKRLPELEERVERLEQDAAEEDTPRMERNERGG